MIYSGKANFLGGSWAEEAAEHRAREDSFLSKLEDLPAQPSLVKLTFVENFWRIVKQEARASSLV